MATQIKLRRDTAANWSDANPTLAAGEPGFETDTGKLKIGDGSKNWGQLSYVTDSVNVDTGDFTFTTGSASLPLGDTMTLNTYQDGGNGESKLTLSPTTTSSLYAANLLQLGVNYGSGSEQYWQFGADGSITFPDASVQTTAYTGGNANTGDVTFEGSILSTPNTTDENWLNGVITLQPGRASSTSYTDWGQFVNIYPTNAQDAPHIHIAAGTGIQSKGDLILGDDNQHVDINHNGQIYVRSYDPIRGQQNFWGFDIDGTFWGPGMGTVIMPAISGPAGNNLYLTGGNNNVRQSMVIRFTDADGTDKSVYTVDTNAYNVGDIPFTNGQPTLWINPNNNASIASITLGSGTATVDFGNPVALSADTDYTVDWYILNTGVGNVVIQSPIEQTNSWTKVTTPVVNIGAGTVVWSSEVNYISSAKLVIQVECSEVGDASGWHSQACEAIIACRGFAGGFGGPTGDPQMIVYGVVHTSVNPLVTFTVQRNPTTKMVEVVGTLTAAAAGAADLRIHSVELSTRD